jgi:outer membrane receptor protein involved in Fe transport
VAFCAAGALLVGAFGGLSAARAEGIGDPAPDVRPRPPPPPPPEEVVRDADLDPLSIDAGLGPPPPRVDPFPLRHVRYRHDTELVSLSGRLMEVRRVPQWVDVIDRDEIVEWRPMDLGFHVGQLPNVTIADGGSPFLQIPGIRGFSGDRVRILTDGVWPSTQALGFYGSSLSLWDPESTERVEVYHGPGAILRAIDSPGGLINVVPRRPRRHGCGSADVHVASGYASADQRWRNRVEVDAGTGRWAALAGVTHTTVGDREAGGGSIGPSSYEQLAADLALDYFLSNRSRLGLTAQYMKADDIETPLGVPGNSIVQPGYDRFFLALTATSFDMGSFFHGTRASISLDSFLQDDQRELGNTSSGLGGESDVKRWDIHLEGTLQLLCGHTTWAELNVGFASLDRREILLCTPVAGGPIAAPPKFDPNVEMTFLRMGQRGATFAVAGQCNTAVNEYEADELAVSALLQDECHTECWDWTGGVRVDFYRFTDTRVGADETDFLVGAAAGLVRHITKRLSVYGNGSFGWREPTLFERHAIEIVDGQTLFGNATLDPEFHGNLEFGTKMAMKDRWALQAAVFGHYTDDFIGPVALFPGTDLELQNKGDALLVGAEIAASWRPITTIEGLELFGTAGTTRSDDENIVDSVPFLWRAGSRYSVPQPKGWNVRRWYGELSFRGASNSENGLRGGPAYVTADALIGVGVDRRCGRGFWANAGITNIFDEDYVPPDSLLPATGLSFLVSFGLDF